MASRSFAKSKERRRLGSATTTMRCDVCILKNCIITDLRDQIKHKTTSENPHPRDKSLCASGLLQPSNNSDRFSAFGQWQKTFRPGLKWAGRDEKFLPPRTRACRPIAKSLFGYCQRSIGLSHIEMISASTPQRLRDDSAIPPYQK